MIGKIFFIFLKFIRSSKIVTFLLWKMRINEYLHKTFWDLTTLVLKKVLLEVNDKKFYLDMGCGQFAILGQFYKRINKNSNVTSVDIYEEFVKNSIKNCELNRINIKVIKSDLFSNITEKFDLISFNPPYVSKKDKNDVLKFPNIRYSELDGIKTTKDFLNDAKKYLNNDGSILLGINTFYVPRQNCIEVIEDTGYKVENITEMKFNTSIVFIIKPI